MSCHLARQMLHFEKMAGRPLARLAGLNEEDLDGTCVGPRRKVVSGWHVFLKGPWRLRLSRGTPLQGRSFVFLERNDAAERNFKRFRRNRLPLHQEGPYGPLQQGAAADHL